MGEGQSHSLVRHRGENPVVKKTRVWYHSTVALVRYDTRVRREQEASSRFFLSFFVIGVMEILVKHWRLLPSRARLKENVDAPCRTVCV